VTNALVDLTGPGGAFEIVIEDVRGIPMQVFKSRLGSMRDLIALADARSDATFIVHGDRRLTFGEHNAAMRTLAASLVRLGVGRGDRVALLSANNPEWVMTFWACAAAGAVCVPLNAWWRADELEFGLRDSGAKVLICDERRHAVVQDVLPRLDGLEHTCVIGAPSFAELLAGDDPGGLPDTPVDEDDIAGIFYTSGTTGTPKGATITHRQVSANLQNLLCLSMAAMMSGQSPPELSSGLQPASLLVVPLFHTTGCHATMVVNYASGGKLVLMPPGRFDPDLAMTLIEAEQVTSIGGVPTIMWRILDSPNFSKYDLSTVKRISYGGAPAAPELVQRINEAFPNVKDTLGTAYGLTETASVATLIAGDDYLAHPGSVGKPVPTVEIKLVGDDGNMVATGENGEIWIKGPTVMSHGYWQRPDANAESFTDGWFHTGDVGRLDDEGYLYIVDRAKDMIIRAGENVYCVEVENVLYEHPDVADVAVVGVPHKVLGEEVKAVVQLRPGASVSADDVRAWCAARLAPFKVPEYVEFRDDPLPRNPAGKVLKNALRGSATSFEDDTDSAL
jgi:long-chain acyl-CoA synthetase